MGTDTPDVRIGAEVLLCENLNKLPQLEELCIYGTNILLIELPFSNILDSHVATVNKILSQGFDVVLAHADKYSSSDIEKFLPLGVKLQLNANSLVTFFKREHLYTWLEKGLVVALGSDIHKKDKSAYKRFAKAAHSLGDRVTDVYAASDKIWRSTKEYEPKIKQRTE